MNYIFWGGKAIGNFLLRGLVDNNHIPKGIVLYKDILDKELVDELKSYDTKILPINKFREQQKEIIAFIKELNVNAYISVSFPFILSKEILELVEFPINIHTGALPKYRGHHPISAAFLNDELYQATTVHFMTEDVDAGEIILQDFIKVENEDNIITVRQKLIELSLKLLLIAIKQIINGDLYSRHQKGEVIWAPKRKPADSKIDFSRSSRYLHNFIRALVDPYPNAFAYCNGKCVKIKKSIAMNTPGVVLSSLGNRQYIVSTGDGVVFIETDLELKINDKLK